MHADFPDRAAHSNGRSSEKTDYAERKEHQKVFEREFPRSRPAPAGRAALAFTLAKRG